MVLDQMSRLDRKAFTRCHNAVCKSPEHIPKTYRKVDSYIKEESKTTGTTSRYQIRVNWQSPE